MSVVRDLPQLVLDDEGVALSIRDLAAWQSNHPFVGLPVIWGIPGTIKPLVGAIAGRARMRFRNEDFARVFFKTSNGIRSFMLCDGGECFRPCYEQGRNLRPKGGAS